MKSAAFTVIIFVLAKLIRGPQRDAVTTGPDGVIGQKSIGCGEANRKSPNLLAGGRLSESRENRADSI